MLFKLQFYVKLFMKTCFIKLLLTKGVFELFMKQNVFFKNTFFKKPFLENEFTLTCLV